MVCEREMGTDVEQLDHLVGYLHVEIKEKLVFLLKERTQVVLVVRKEWTLAIGRGKGVPVYMAPVGMIGYANVFD